MKILMLCEFYNPDLEYQENLLVKYYQKHGHDVLLITSTYDSVFNYYSNIHDNSSPKRELQHHGAKIIKLPFTFNFKGKLKKYTSIKKITEDFQPDLLYIHDIMPNMMELIAYKEQNPHVKMIMDYHADYSNSAHGWLSLNILHKIIRKKWYMDRIKSHISKFFPIIPGSQQFLREVYDIPDSRMEILPLGADVDLVNEIKNSGKRSEIRKNLNIPENHKVIFSGGKFTPAKKIDLLLEAFDNLQNNEVHLIIVGGADDKNESYKKQLYSLAKDNPQIHFVGWLKNREVYEYLAAADIAVFPASQSIVWQQALATELPLIIGDTGGQSLDYLNEFGAILEMTGAEITADHIKINIEKIINDAGKFNEMKLAAARTRDKFLDWNHLIHKTFV